MVFTIDRRDFCLFGAAALAWTGGASPAKSEPTTLVQIVQPEPPTLASFVSTAGSIGQVTGKIFDGLLEYGFDLKPRPSLSEAWSVSQDGKMITFRLRGDVRFHDGTPLTSADVLFSLDTLRKHHPRGVQTFREVIGIEAPDPHTVVLTLKDPAPYILSALSSWESPIIPKHIYELGDIKQHAFANKPVGSGPFSFVDWRRGEVIRLERNDQYWKSGAPKLDRVVIRFVADSATRTALLERGDAHIAGAGAVPYNDVKRLQDNLGLDVTTKGYEMISPVVELIFNTKKPPFDQAKVRQAISYGIDRRFIVDHVWFGFGKPATGPISSNFAPNGIYTSDVRNFAVPDRVAVANSLLDEAGLPRDANGVRFSLVHDICPYGEEWQRFGEAVKQQLASLGINVTLRYEDVPTWLKRIWSDYDFDLSSSFLYNLADPVIGVDRGLHSKAIKPGTVLVNASRWSSARTDELMDRAAIEIDPSKRAGLYHEFQKIIAEEVPVAYVLEIKFPTVVNRQFAEVITDPLGLYSSFSETRPSI